MLKNNYKALTDQRLSMPQVWYLLLLLVFVVSCKESDELLPGSFKGGPRTLIEETALVMKNDAAFLEGLYNVVRSCTATGADSSGFRLLQSK